ncbi:MAG: ABC transporter permease [Propionibacteriaceae bacterium]|uniref:Binding-protein-dependent transport system inner membrane component n=1 Tax=Propionibacterium ruminifibrarum TaxID=1962131 RepID=A0A375I649_9ACTN|nr:ABC transporter permease [Propionibacterium ruminifibrarum]MBE6477129.1 ABC transporter permease [Propionibacteriaceae bacterium]SPF69319.1 Binding-protein-dependent transport system inner membrane component [Propionibacterium ruminifibrarum]
MGAFIASRWADIAFRMYQHASLVAQSVLLAAVIAVALAVVVTSVPRLEPIANAISTIGLTIPSFALLGLFIPLFGIGTTTSVAVVTFYAALPILRNAVVGLLGVDRALLESARGMGMKPLAIFLRVQLPLAWPVILTGLRVSTQMSMGVAAIAAYVLGPGLGSYIFTGLAQIGGRNALNYAVVGTVGVVVVALIADAVLALIGRLTISKGIRA